MEEQGKESVVCDNAKILICKQFTTIQGREDDGEGLFAIMQRY